MIHLAYRKNNIYDEIDEPNLEGHVFNPIYRDEVVMRCDCGLHHSTVQGKKHYWVVDYNTYKNCDGYWKCSITPEDRIVKDIVE